MPRRVCTVPGREARVNSWVGAPAQPLSGSSGIHTPERVNLSSQNHAASATKHAPGWRRAEAWNQGERTLRRRARL